MSEMEAKAITGRERLAVLKRGRRALPSILAADFARLGDEVRPLVLAGVEVLHVDVMDGHFVPNISLGPPIVRSLRAVTDAFLDTHLMISEPLRYFESFVKAGSDLLTLHAETGVSPVDARAEADRLGIGLGVAIKPKTDVDEVVEAWAEYSDLILIMSVEPGFGGQSYIPEAEARLARTRDLCRARGVDPILEVDGGIDSETVSSAVEGGAEWLVAGSAIFRQDDPLAAWLYLESGPVAP